MKKLLLIFLVFAVLSGFVMAEDFSFSVGAEVTIEDVTGDRDVTLWPWVSFDASLFNGILDFYTGLAFGLGFYDAFDDTGARRVPMDLSFDIGVIYNLFLGRSSALSFALENTLDFVLSPRIAEGNNFSWTLNPGVIFSQEIAHGDIYAMAMFPLTDIHNWSGEPIVDFEPSIGFASYFGHDFRLTGLFSLNPGGAFDSISLTPKAFFTITEAFGAYLSLAIDGIGGNGRELIFSPTVGAFFRF